MSFQVTRRQLGKRGAAAAAGLATTASGPWTLDALSATADAAAPCGRLEDIEHVVILIQENRSFDQYFGRLRGVKGFSDPHVLRQSDGQTVFAQPGYTGPNQAPPQHLRPFHLDIQISNAACTNDINHSWGPQHRSWNGGKMDGFVKTHLSVDGPGDGPLTMGYYDRGDLPYYYALADAFTVCDQYFCSVIGPT